VNSLPRLQAPEEKSARTHTGGLIVLRCWRDVLEKEVEIWFLQQEETDRYKARHVPDLLAWHATIEGLENASSPWATRNAPPLQSAHPCHRYETSSTSVILVSTTVLSSLERERERERERARQDLTSIRVQGTPTRWKADLDDEPRQKSVSSSWVPFQEAWTLPPSPSPSILCN
jgi:hypothetical protein